MFCVVDMKILVPNKLRRCCRGVEIFYNVIIMLQINAKGGVKDLYAIENVKKKNTSGKYLRKM